jgi:hypothetical protein
MTEPGIAASLHRVENLAERILDKVDAHGQVLAAHAVRLDHVEDDVRELKSADAAEVRQGMTFRAALAVALLGAATSSALSVVITLASAR